MNKTIQWNSRIRIVISAVLSALLIIFTIINKDKFWEPVYEYYVFKTQQFITTITAGALIFPLGSLRLNKSSRGAQIAGMVLYTAMALFGTMVIASSFSDGFSASVYEYAVNVCLYCLAAFAVLAISGSVRWAAVTSITVSYLFNLISYTVYTLRGTVFAFADLYALRTAMNVASGYTFSVNHNMVTATAVYIVLMITAFKLPSDFAFIANRLKIRILAVILAAVSVFTIQNTEFDKYTIEVFAQNLSDKVYGSAFCFYANALKVGLKKSESYNPETLETELLKYSDAGEMPEEMPNIIVVMNESFADLSNVGEFEASEEYMPYFKSCTENVIKGTTLVSPFGGGTCNSEYEFLTGMSMSCLNSESKPYVQMMFKDLPYSLVSHMKKLGYKTTAFHPYFASGWNRTAVYKYMGFDNFISAENMGEYNNDAVLLRDFIDDKSNYDAVLNMLYAKEPGEKQFIFNITMQNHSPYNKAGFEADIKLKNMRGEYPYAEQYMTIMKKSDEALDYFMFELSEYEEPVILLIFGDHMPNIEEGFYSELYGKAMGELTSEESAMRYETPFMIWANYDMGKTEEDIKTSVNYLSNILMEAADLPKSRVQLYLDGMRKELPRVNAFIGFDKNGKSLAPLEYDGIGEYTDMQYALLTAEPLPYDF